MSKIKWLALVVIGIIFCLAAEDVEANIILKSMAINPSKTKTQKVVLKAYLPKEAKPEDIVDLGDLKIDYDITKELHYVYKEFELKPGESVSRSIEIRDIWAIAKAEIEAITNRAEKLSRELKKTAYSNVAANLQQDIKDKSRQILDRQRKAENAFPQVHISVYRQNVEILSLIRDDLTELERMLLKVKLAASSGGEKRVSVKASWRVILAVIISLGVFSFIFFIIWHRQVGVAEAKQEAKEEEVNEE